MFPVTIYRPRKHGSGLNGLDDLIKVRTIPVEDLVFVHWRRFGNQNYGKLGIGQGRRKKPKEII